MTEPDWATPGDTSNAAPAPTSQPAAATAAEASGG